MYEEGKLKSAKEIKKILGKRGLGNLGFFEEKVTAEQAAMLNRAEEELLSVSDVDKVGDIELQEIAKSMENLISQMSQTEGDRKRYPFENF